VTGVVERSGNCTLLRVSGRYWELTGTPAGTLADGSSVTGQIAGLTTTGLTDFLVQANTRVQSKLNPACTTATYTIIPGRRTSVTQCTGYDGVKAQSKCQLSMAHCASGTPFVVAAKREASAMTSWKVADTAKVVFAGWAPAMAATRAGQNG
jgi:hypothetical protein